MRMLPMIVLMLPLAACRQAVKPDLPGPGMAVTPTVVTVQRIVYVKVPAALTKPEPIAEGPIPQCFDVAAQRRAALERANSKLKQIAQIQGTQVKP